jgi:hypothetical protein
MHVAASWPKAHIGRNAMASEIKAPTVTGVTELPTSHVPFVYFDGVVSHGANHGVIQLELAAKIVVPDPTEKTGARTQVVVTAHVRCSPDAAADLKRAIDSALSLAKRPSPRAKRSPAERTSKPN